METKFSILFYSKTTKITRDGSVPIYLRVTINGERFEQSTQRYILLPKWSAEAGKAKGSSEESKTINYYLDAVRQKVYDYQSEIIREKLQLNVETFRTKWLDIQERGHTILGIFHALNEQLKQLIGVLNNIYGVDIDANAVEVIKLSFKLHSKDIKRSR